MNRLINHQKMLEYELLLPYSNIFCFSTQRAGGVSRGAYASMNCTPYTGDDPEAVRRNRSLLLDLLPKPAQLVIPVQTHSTEVLTIDEAFLSLTDEAQQARLQGVDALTTNVPGVCLCISTADCVPVMMYDTAHQVVAVAHAGWRGTVGRIVEKTLARMAEQYGTQGAEVVACIGPSISLEAFETGEEVYQTFRAQGFDMSRIARRNETTGKWHLDLWQANVDQLTHCGVQPSAIEVCGICTYKEVATYFSARRLGVKSGRILSGMMLKK